MDFISPALQKNKADIKSMPLDELTQFVTSLGEQPYRARQIFRWLHRGVYDFDKMSDLSKALAQKLCDNAYINRLAIEKKLVSKLDFTVKYLFKLMDSNYIETVVMKYKHGYSICVSSQAGCRMGCRFCQSTKGGLIRNLTASEILDQIIYAQNDLSVRISNIVMMGIGEPLDNYDNVLKFLKIVNEPLGLGIGYRHISLSTCGLCDGIDKLAAEGLPITLSISLHQSFNDKRSELMPVNRKYSLGMLIDACRRYQARCGRRISFEYALIEGVNDSEKDAENIAKLLKGIMCHVNIIPVNTIKDSKYKRPGAGAVEHFQQLLLNYKINATVRRTLGGDINASCGQLRSSLCQEEGNT